jgi:integrase
MPKPYFLTRPSGVYVRFLVPSDLRPALGSRYLIRALGMRHGDEARLVAAAQGVALSQAFDAMRRGTGMVDVKKLLESAQQAAADGSVREWTATGVRVGGIDFGNVTTSGRADTQDFIQTMRAAVKLAQQGQPMVIPAAALTSSQAPVAKGPLLSAEVANHIADLERRQLSPDTITESKHTLRLFLGTTGDIPVHDIKPTHIRTFLDAIRWWPERASIKPKFRGKTVLQIIDAGKKSNVPPPSQHTLNKHHQRLGVFLNGLVNLDLINKNPLKAIKPDINTSTELDTGRAFSVDELKALFEPARFTAWAGQSPHRWWGTMLGLYTGARVNEVGQLYLDDVREVGGVWGVFFWKNGRNQKIKNKPSIRFVPLAQPLLDAGFLDFIEDMKRVGHPRLFPHLPAGTRADGKPNGKGYGRQLSRQFAAYAKTVGIEKGTAFHSFRHTLSTMLAEAGVSSPDIAAITGHAVVGQVPTLDKHYIHIAHTATLPKRVETLSKFKPPVTLLLFRSGKFQKSLENVDGWHP